MASNEEREKHSRRRKRNLMARALREKVNQPKINPKLTEYKREKINLREVEIEVELDNE